jgi:hypothetical protein
VCLGWAERALVLVCISFALRGAPCGDDPGCGSPVGVRSWEVWGAENLNLRWHLAPAPIRSRDGD